RLRLAMEPSALLIGFAATVLVVLGALLWTVRRAGRVPAARLLAGALTPGSAAGRRAGRGLRLLVGGAVLPPPLLRPLLPAGASPWSPQRSSSASPPRCSWCSAPSSGPCAGRAGCLPRASWLARSPPAVQRAGGPGAGCGSSSAGPSSPPSSSARSSPPAGS